MMRHLDKTRAPLRPFRIEVANERLAELRDRINRTRWPDAEAGWPYGAPLAQVKSLAAYWRDVYDWRKHEDELNDFPQFVTEADGAKLHFLHVRSAQPDALPLLLVHGWPGSIVELTPLVGPLTSPRAHGGRAADAFHVVVPSIPGFGFSGPTRDGWDVARVARTFAALMTRLGYQRFGVHGRDLGAAVGRELERTLPGRIVAVHEPAGAVGPAPARPSAEAPHAEAPHAEAPHAEAPHAEARHAEAPHAEAPHAEALAYSLHDSPVGLLAWISEAFPACERDSLLTSVMLYWLTGTAGSSARFYLENAEGGAARPAGPAAPEDLRACFRRRR